MYQIKYPVPELSFRYKAAQLAVDGLVLLLLMAFFVVMSVPLNRNDIWHAGCLLIIVSCSKYQSANIVGQSNISLNLISAKK